MPLSSLERVLERGDAKTRVARICDEALDSDIVKDHYLQPQLLVALSNQVFDDRFYEADEVRCFTTAPKAKIRRDRHVKLPPVQPAAGNPGPKHAVKPREAGADRLPLAKLSRSGHVMTNDSRAQTAMQKKIFSTCSAKIRQRERAKTISQLGGREELEQLLQKGQYERTSIDVQRMAQMIRHLVAFANLSDFVLEQLCGVVHFNEFEKGRIIFRQGDEGTSWYVVLSGRVQVLVSYTGSYSMADSEPVRQLDEGDGFGELALVSDQPRAATILTLTPCKMLRVEKGDYLRIIRFNHDKQAREKVLVLKKIPIFALLPDMMLKSIANSMTQRTFPPGTELLAQGDEVNEVWFIREGVCEVEAWLDFDTTRIRIVTLGTISVGDYFGEASVKKGDIRSPYTIRSVSNVQVLILASNDARAKINRELAPSSLWEIASKPEKLEEAYRRCEDLRMWAAYKRRVMKSLGKSPTDFSQMNNIQIH
ncbi:Rap guanine nucleotide exchange factor 4 [Irineochytrium annulatum]|nr:Rap guanine nucleotide exchange factor 4 [Irineochytrium annulatum]